MTHYTGAPTDAHSYEATEQQTKLWHRVLLEAMRRNKPLLVYYVAITVFSWSPSIYQGLSQGEWSSFLVSLFASGATLFIVYWMIEIVLEVKDEIR